MSKFLSFIYIVYVEIIVSCFGQIWNCDNKFEHKSPVTSTGVDDPAAVWCANEGGSCEGPGVVYYGTALTWTYSDYIDDHETISCSNHGFGCDPLVAFTKKCYSFVDLFDLF